MLKMEKKNVELSYIIELEKLKRLAKILESNVHFSNRTEKLLRNTLSD